jgi:hypothetical protein
MAKTTGFTPTAATQEVMDLIAHISIASEIDRNVEGMKGSLDHYLKSLTPRQRVMWRHFQNTAKRVREDVLKLMEADGWDKKGSANG